MNASTDDMKTMVQEWIAQAIDFEQLGEIYFAIRYETEKQFLYVAESIAKKGGAL